MNLQPKACKAAVGRLAPRQREVLKLLANGHARKTIADQLAISMGTVSAHCEAIYAKLGVSSVAQAVVIASKSGL